MAKYYLNLNQKITEKKHGQTSEVKYFGTPGVYSSLGICCVLIKYNGSSVSTIQ